MVKRPFSLLVYGLVFVACGLILFFMGGCMASLQGEDINAKELMTPSQLPAAETVKEPPVQPANTIKMQSLDAFLMWIAPMVDTNGDRVDGHFIEVSTKHPTVEVLEPMKTLPRTPLPGNAGGASQERPQAPRSHPPALVSPQGLPSGAQMVQPSPYAIQPGETPRQLYQRMFPQGQPMPRGQ